ncbi:MAG: hypothetical protein Q4F80_02400 [bacterium]|nr:hypothetical protein [bacterium]
MLSHKSGKPYFLTNNDKAAALNLAFLLNIVCYDREILKLVSLVFSKEEKLAIYEFWQKLTPETARAFLCMVEFEGRI